MLNAEFEEFRLTVMWYSSQLTNELQQKLQLGQDTKPLLFKTYVLNRYLDIFLEYKLQTEADYLVENTNFFTVEDMIEIQNRLNDLIDTDFNYDWLLTT